MTVIHQTGWITKPGRDLEFIQAVPKARAIHVRLGAKVRVWRAIAAGPNTGRLGYSLEFDTFSAFTKFSTTLQADPEWQALVPTYWGPDSPATSQGNSVFSTLPGLDDGPSSAPGGPRVRAFRQFSVEKGRQQEVRQLLGEFRAHLLRLGALRVRAVQPIAAGPSAPIIAFAAEHADLAAYGTYMDKAFADAEATTFIWTRLAAVGSPLTQIGTALQVEIP